jgi:molybdopterin-guanine dinucleotide biosynthesis protein A
MGTDKAFLDFEGRTLLERALIVMGEVCDQVAIVGDPEKFAGHGVVVQDRYAGCGPLAGIHAALLHSSAELNLILAVDMPFVTRELLAFLLAKAEATQAEVVVPRTSSGSQPLCAVYRRAFSHAAEEALASGKYKIDALFSGATVRVVDEKELASAGFTERLFFNVNTPKDFRAARGDIA